MIKLWNLLRLLISILKCGCLKMFVVGSDGSKNSLLTLVSIRGSNGGLDDWSWLSRSDCSHLGLGAS